MMKDYDAIYYIVQVRNPLHFTNTTITERFCGKLVNQNNGNFYFELNGSGALVIIPHNEIEWMAPSKKHWPLGTGE